MIWNKPRPKTIRWESKRAKTFQYKTPLTMLNGVILTNQKQTSLTVDYDKCLISELVFGFPTQTLPSNLTLT